MEMYKNFFDTLRKTLPKEKDPIEQAFQENTLLTLEKNLNKDFEELEALVKKYQHLLPLEIKKKDICSSCGEEITIFGDGEGSFFACGNCGELKGWNRFDIETKSLGDKASREGVKQKVKIKRFCELMEKNHVSVESHDDLLSDFKNVLSVIGEERIPRNIFFLLCLLLRRNLKEEAKHLLVPNWERLVSKNVILSKEVFEKMNWTFPQSRLENFVYISMKKQVRKTIKSMFSSSLRSVSSP